MKKGKDNEANRMMKALRNQGFPLEVEVTETLKSSEWLVSNQVAFIDPDEEKYRTVDMVATKTVYQKDKKAISISLVVECKKSNKPWVFYVSEHKAVPEQLGDALKELDVLSYDVVMSDPKDSEIAPVLGELLRNTRYLPWHKNAAYIASEPMKKGGSPNQILDAVMKVSKYINYQTGRTRDILRGLTEGFSLTVLVLPLVVFEGNLYAYEANRLERVRALLYDFDYLEKHYMIDIVTKDFLIDYLGHIGQL